jgi:hypothetical protein
MSTLARKYLEEALTNLATTVRHDLEKTAAVQQPGFQSWIKKFKEKHPHRNLVKPTIIDGATNSIRMELQQQQQQQRQQQEAEEGETEETRPLNASSIEDVPSTVTPTRHIRLSLFDVIGWRKDFGVGLQVTRVKWKQRYPDTYWTVKRVRLNPTSLRHGRAWGILTWKGQSENIEQEIRNPLKKEWIPYTQPSVVFQE